MLMNNSPWWKASVGYILYPAAFADSNGDGVGDLPGVIAKLDYLQSLGIDLIWMNPIFKSPMDDNGYDVSSYYEIDPRFGNIEDFKRLLQEAHARGIRILIDFVLNHTSDEHPWFQKALKEPDSEERGYYFFAKGKKEGDVLLPPNNWKGFFSTSVWQRVEGTEDYYMHIFSSKMPDVNWANPALREKYYEIARFYLDLGVDGFRLDALAHLSKEETLSDSDKPSDENGLVYDPSRFSNREPVYGYLAEFKEKVLSHYDCLTIGEVGGGVSPEESLRYSDKENGSISMVFNFDTAWMNGAYGSIDKRDEEIFTDVIALKKAFLRWHEACKDKADLPFYWCNHDHPRVLSQYGDPRFRDESAKMLLTTLLFLPGTPFIYFGDEIGMSNVHYEKPEDFYSDVGNKNEVASLRSRGYSDEQITHYLNRCSRVNARTPMQWNRDKNAGFSTGTPINKVNDNYLQGVNVEQENANPWSILNFYRYAIAMRKRSEILEATLNGSFHILDMNHPDVFAYVREGNQKYVIISNFRPYQVYFSFWFNIEDVLLHNYGDVVINDHVFTLRPFETFLLKV